MSGPGVAAPPPAGIFAAAAIPARFTIERNAWADAAALVPRESPFPWADAVTYFARGLGAARSGNSAAAVKDVEKLTALRDALEQAKDAYWSEQVEIQRRATLAWIAFAEGRNDEALVMMREAADMEDATEKSAVTPGPMKPARELLGEMLLEVGRPADALTEFELTVTKEPNRFRGVYGAARAAMLAGDAAKAETYYAKLLEICERADQPGRPELEEARKAAGP
jgi:tetratricopeptide (TPR) repeat protein